MRLAWLSVLVPALAAASPAAAQQPVQVPSDPQARYQLLDMAWTPDGAVELLTRRDGLSGTSFALREVDCRGGRVRYLGLGDTREKAMQRTTRDQPAPIFEGSVSWHVARFACREASAPP